ncbi:MAG: glycosyltransferase [Kastovskya adunca ATA6-11-RM4]|jgi:glycosyltransferase involved in cell wall biosynthesis|nr:glycosyltransferase [Kastovskya adunca ATA6-11-RM4]
MPILNTTLTLKDLPPPPPGKTGWPWTEQSFLLPDRIRDRLELPRISIVTPNYNQGEFIEETIRSVLLQNYPSLEYIIIDGGSTDESIKIIKKYEQYLAFWTSEPDRGQSHAINKGFERCTGDYIAWMNADDCYLPDALHHVFVEAKANKFDFIYGCTYNGSSLNDKYLSYRSGTQTFATKYLLRAFYGEQYVIPSQSVFVSRRLFEKVGLIDENSYYCMDIDWFIRMALERPRSLKISQPICFYRLHPQSKTISSGVGNREEALNLTQKYASHLSFLERLQLNRLINYSEEIRPYFAAYAAGKQKQPFQKLLGTMMKFPLEALSNRKFIGLLKRAVAPFK